MWMRNPRTNTKPARAAYGISVRIILLLLIALNLKAQEGPVRKLTIRYLAHDVKIANANLLKMDPKAVNSFTISDSFCLFFSGPWRIYEINGVHNYQSDLVLDSSQRMKFLVLARQQHPDCYWLRNWQDTRPEKDRLDSFIRQHALAGADLFDADNMKLAGTEYRDDSALLIKSYVFKQRRDDTFPDTVYYSFSRQLAGVDFTFSARLDTLAQYKLNKVEFCTGIIPGLAAPLPVEKRFRKVMVFEMLEREVTQPGVVHELIATHRSLF